MKERQIWSSFPVEIENQDIGWSGAFGDKICLESTFSVNRCIDTVVMVEGRRWSSVEFVVVLL